MPGSPTQVEALRRGLTLAALIWTEARTVADLARALDLSDRDVQRMIAGLRAAPGVEVEVSEPERYRISYRMTRMPDWMESAIRRLAVAPSRKRA